MATDDTGISDATPVSSTLSQDDLNNIIRTVNAEAGNQGPAGWTAVANVIKNRLGAGTYGNSASAVVQQPKQFSSWNDGAPSMPDADTLAKMTPVIQDVFSGSSPDNTNGATHFYANQGPNAIPAPSWAQGATPIQIGQQAFLKAAGGGGVSPSTTASIPAPATPPVAPTDMTGGNGAMNANFLTNGVGTLFGMTPQQSSGLGSRIERVSAGLASISSPRQAAVIASLAPKVAASPWTDEGAAPSKQGRMQLNTQTGQYRYVPNPTGANNDSPETMATNDTTALTKYQEHAQTSSDTIDEINKLEKQLTTDPSVYGHYSVTNDPSSWIANSEGLSTSQSQFVKGLNSVINKGVIAIQQGGSFSRPTNAIMATEKASLAPTGALSDPVTTFQALERLKQQMNEQYGSAMLGLNSQKIRFKKNMPYDPAAYDKANQARWSAANAEIQKSYHSVLVPYHHAQVYGAPLSTQNGYEPGYGGPNQPTPLVASILAKNGVKFQAQQPMPGVPPGMQGDWQRSIPPPGLGVQPGVIPGLLPGLPVAPM